MLRLLILHPASPAGPHDASCLCRFIDNLNTNFITPLLYAQKDGIYVFNMNREMAIFAGER